MSALTVTIHALLIARAQVQEDRDVQFRSSVNPSTGVVEGESESGWLAGYDSTLATIDEAIERAKREPEVELLEALQGIVSECAGPERPYSGDSYLPPHLLDAGRAAVAKALGAAS